MPLDLPPSIARAKYAILRQRNSPNLRIVELLRPEPEYRPIIYDHALISAFADLRRARGGPGDGAESWGIILRCGPAAARD